MAKGNKGKATGVAKPSVLERNMQESLSVSYIMDGGGDADRKRQRSQQDRRSLQERARRAIAVGLPHITKQVLETKRVDGKLIEDRVILAFQEKGVGGRVSKAFWASISRQYGNEMTDLFEHTPTSGHRAKDEFMVALDEATSPDNKACSFDSLVVSLQVGDLLGERDHLV